MTRAPHSRLSVQQLEDRCVPATFVSLQLAFDGAPFDPALSAGAGAVSETRFGHGGGGGAGKVSMNDIGLTFATAPDAGTYLKLDGVVGESPDASGPVSGRVTGVVVDPTSAIQFVGGWGASSYQYAFVGASGAGDDIFVDGRIITGEASAVRGHELGHAPGLRHEHVRPAVDDTHKEEIEIISWNTGSGSGSSDSLQSREALASDSEDAGAGIHVPIKIKHNL